LISANYNANTLTVLTNNGSGGFGLASSPGVGLNPISVTAADVNGDGKVDLISANANANSLTVLTNNGSGGFVLSSSPGVGNSPRSIAAADVNGTAGWIWSVRTSTPARSRCCSTRRRSPESSPAMVPG